MFTDESHIISCLINRYKHKTFKGKRVVFNFMFTENRFYRSILFFRVRFFSFTDDLTWLFHSEKWFLWMPLSFDILSVNWSVTVCIFSRASSKQICFGSRYCGPLDMSWQSLSLLTILRSPVINDRNDYWLRSYCIYYVNI